MNIPISDPNEHRLTRQLSTERTTVFIGKPTTTEPYAGTICSWISTNDDDGCKLMAT